MIDLETTTTTDLDNLARQLKVLAEPNRLRMVDLLMQGVQWGARHIFGNG